MSKTFYSLRFINFRLWFVSNFFSATAIWMQRVCQAWVVLTVLTSGSAFAVGVTTALQFAPQLLVGVLGGVLADSVNRRRLLQVTQILVAVLGLVLGILLLTDNAHLYHVYLIAFVTGFSDAISIPVRQTFISELVPRENLPNAVALNSTAFNTARLFGPAIAGVLIELVGPGWVFVVNCAVFSVPIITLSLMRQKYFFPHRFVPRHRGMLREGFHYVRSREDLKALIALIIVVSGLGFNFQITQAIMATQVYGKGAGEYGLLGSMLAIGSLTGALLAARRSSSRFSLVLGAAGFFGLAEGVAALAPSYLTFALLMIPTGLCMMTVLVSSNSLIQITTPEELRGRAISIYMMFNLGVTPFFAPTVGWVGEYLGPRWSLGVGAIASILAVAVIFLVTKVRWRVSLRPSGSWPFVDIDGPRERAAAERAAQDSGLISPDCTGCGR